MSTRCRILFVLVCTLSASALQGQELPPRAVARLGDYRFYHGSSIELVALSPDGSRVASLAAKPSYFRHITDKDRDPFDRTIVLWDAVSGQRVRELQALAKPVQSLAFSPDGKQLLAVCGGSEANRSSSSTLTQVRSSTSLENSRKIFGMGTVNSFPPTASDC
jgi:WD40 repeat protein